MSRFAVDFSYVEISQEGHSVYVSMDEDRSYLELTPEEALSMGQELLDAGEKAYTAKYGVEGDRS